MLESLNQETVEAVERLQQRREAAANRMKAALLAIGLEDLSERQREAVGKLTTDDAKQAVQARVDAMEGLLRLVERAGLKKAREAMDAERSTLKSMIKAAKVWLPES
eukprot:3531346-Rhodomonas_salina.1